MTDIRLAVYNELRFREKQAAAVQTPAPAPTLGFPKMPKMPWPKGLSRSAPSADLKLPQIKPLGGGAIVPRVMPPAGSAVPKTGPVDETVVRQRVNEWLNRKANGRTDESFMTPGELNPRNYQVLGPLVKPPPPEKPGPKAVIDPATGLHVIDPKTNRFKFE